MSRHHLQHRVVDVLLVAVCVLAGAWEGLQSGLFDGSPIIDRPAPLAVDVALGVGTGLAVLVRDRWPLLTYGGALLSWGVSGAWPALLVAQFVVGAHLRSLRAQLGLTAIMLVAVGTPLWTATGGDGAVPLSAALCVLPVVVGHHLAHRHEVMADLAERARRNEREEWLRINQARAEERAQIARDMHDVVTHRVSLMVLHATALEARLTAASESTVESAAESAEAARRRDAAEAARRRDAAAMAAQIQSIGRAALEELRTLVGVLRDGAAAPLRPQPGIADLAELVDASRDLGLTVDLVVDDGVRAPALVEHAVYRVVQEALTNVHKHAPGAHTTVSIRPTWHGLRLVVRDTGGGLAPAVTPGGGHGLLGISERVRLIGGTLRSQRLPEGGFEVSAYLPVVDVGRETAK